VNRGRKAHGCRTSLTRRSLQGGLKCPLPREQARPPARSEHGWPSEAVGSLLQSLCSSLGLWSGVEPQAVQCEGSQKGKKASANTKCALRNEMYAGSKAEKKPREIRWPGSEPQIGGLTDSCIEWRVRTVRRDSCGPGGRTAYISLVGTVQAMRVVASSRPRTVSSGDAASELWVTAGSVVQESMPDRTRLRSAPR
jgi:hypothetical protein